MEVYDYKGWKIPNKLHIFSRKTIKEHYGYSIPQAMIASSDKEAAINTAQKWASCKYRDWTEDDYIRYDIDNEGIEFELLDSAGGSSQGGKLSFWNCIISKGDMKVIVGISADILIELLKNTDFKQGKCQSKIILARYKNQWGAITKDMKEYKEAVKDMQINNILNSSKKTSKWEQGYEYYSKTQKDTYLYDLYKWNELEKGYWYDRYSTACLTEYKVPKTEKVTLEDWCYKDCSKLSEYIDKHKKDDSDWYVKKLFLPSSYNIKPKLPSRIKGNKVLDVDISLEEINNMIKEYRKKSIEQYLSHGDDNPHKYADLVDIIYAFSYSVDKNDKPIIPEEIFKEIKKLFNYKEID